MTNRDKTVDNSAVKSQIVDSEQAWRPAAAHDQATIPKPLKPLTRRRKAFVKQLTDNPKQAAYKAAQAAGYIGNEATLRATASHLLTKDNILAELVKYDNTAQSVIVEVMEYSKELGRSGTAAGAAYAANARQSADSLLDRIHGKAKQVTEVNQRSVNINIDLTQAVLPETPENITG